MYKTITSVTDFKKASKIKNPNAELQAALTMAKILNPTWATKTNPAKNTLLPTGELTPQLIRNNSRYGVLITGRFSQTRDEIDRVLRGYGSKVMGNADWEWRSARVAFVGPGAGDRKMAVIQRAINGMTVIQREHVDNFLENHKNGLYK